MKNVTYSHKYGIFWHHDPRYSDTQHNDIKYNGIQQSIN